MSLRILVLKTKKLSDFLTQWSKLFHSIMVDREKEFWKSRVLCLERGCYVYFGSSMTSVEQKSRCLGFSFPKTLLKGNVFYVNVDLKGTLMRILDRFFSFDDLTATFKATHALYWVDFIFSLNELLKAWSYW